MLNAGHEDSLRVVIHTPYPGTDAADKLRLLGAVGTPA